MGRIVAGFLALLALVGGSCVVRLARAEGGEKAAAALPDASRLRYRVAEGCPTESEFVAAVGARGASFESPDSNAGPSLFDVTIEAGVSGFRASLTVVNESSASNARELRAATCIELVNALAVVTAIALQTPPPSTSLPTDSDPAPPPERLNATKAGMRSRSVAWRKVTRVEAGAVRIDNDVSITVAGAALFGLMPPYPLPRLDLQFERANFVTLPNGDSLLVGPVVRLRGSLLLDQTVTYGDQRAELGGQELGIGVCVSPFYDTRSWQLLACNEISAGLLGARTTSAAGARSGMKTQGFGAIGGGVEASYDFGAHVQVGLRLGGQVLTNLVRVNGDDGTELFHSSRVLGMAALSLGAHF